MSSLLSFMVLFISLIRLYVWCSGHNPNLGLLWLLPICHDSCPGSSNTSADLNTTNNATIPIHAPLTNLPGQFHAWVHWQRKTQQSLIEHANWPAKHTELQYAMLRDIRARTPSLSSHRTSATWRSGRGSGQIRRETNVAYLNAWLQDAQSEAIACRLAAQLRYTTMLAACDRLERPGQMLMTLMWRDTQDLNKSSRKMATLMSDREAIDLKLADHEATFLEAKRQYSIKHEKLREHEVDKGEVVTMQAEVDTMQKEYYETRRALESEKLRLDKEAMASFKHMRPQPREWT